MTMSLYVVNPTINHQQCFSIKGWAIKSSPNGRFLALCLPNW